MAALRFTPSSLPCSTSSRFRSSSPLSATCRWPVDVIAHVFLIRSVRRRAPRIRRRPLIGCALAESDSPKSIDQQGLRPLLQEIAESFKLPAEYLEKLPQDLRIDLNDAAFDLANGPVLDECGQEVGGLFSSLARSWEKAETSTSSSIASELPLLEANLNDSVKSATGRRLLSAGRRFQGMGHYGNGELLRIGRAMVEAGKVLSASPATSAGQKPQTEVKMFKFGDLQVKLTPQKANIGAAIGLGFGILSWVLGQGVQSIPESSLQYANDNALLLAKSLRGALLAMTYSSAVLSSFTAVGLVLLSRQLSDTKDK
ncbi:LOW protein: ammonium transporter 1-like protein [Wolffia australiana]